MKIRSLALPTLIALASVAGVLADVVQGPALTATGRVVSTGNTSLVVKTDDHGHSIAFVVGTTTDMPSGVVAGSRVTVHYHPVGTDQQMADRIVILEPGIAPGLASMGNGGQEPASPAPAPAEAPSPDAPRQPTDAELPRTASPIPLVGLLGLGALLASGFLRALERR